MLKNCNRQTFCSRHDVIGLKANGLNSPVCKPTISHQWVPATKRKLYNF